MQKFYHWCTIGIGTHIQEMEDFVLCLSPILTLFFQLKTIFQKLIKVFEVVEDDLQILFQQILHCRHLGPELEKRPHPLLSLKAAARLVVKRDLSTSVLM